MTVYAQAPMGECAPWITPGERYEVTSDGYRRFAFENDYGEHCLGSWTVGCSHLCGGIWTRVEEREELADPRDARIAELEAMLGQARDAIGDVLNDLGPGGYLLPAGAVRTARLRAVHSRLQGSAA